MRDEKVDDDLTEWEHKDLRREVAALRAERQALRDVLDFAVAAIGDAIYTEDGLDGADGERVLQLCAEAKERGTFDKVLVPLSESLAAFSLTQRAALKVVLDFLPPLERVTYEDPRRWIEVQIAEVAATVRSALSATNVRRALSAGSEPSSSTATPPTNA